MDRSYLQELDELRYTDPEKAAELAAEAIVKATDTDRPLCLGIYGSARRKLGDLKSARAAIREGLRAAYKAGDWWTVANLTARLGYVAGDDGNWRAAAQLASHAQSHYSCAGDQDGVGRALIDRGRALYYLGHPEETLACNARALDLLAPSSLRNRYSALIGSGVAATELGRLPEARHFLAQAEEPAEQLGPSMRAYRLGLIAEIHEMLGDLSSAEKALLSAAEIYFRLSPVDSALAAVRAVGLIVQQGEYERASQAAWRLVPYLESCRRSKAVAGAISSLIQARNSLDARAVQQVARLISRHSKAFSAIP